MSEPKYIWIRNWDRFQHYKDRRPPWIKFYVELLDDDAYLELTEHRALLLHRLWLAFASSRSRLRLDTSSLSRHTFLRVTAADIESLNGAGFIDIVDSTGLAQRLQSAMPRARVRAHAETDEETETDEEKRSSTRSGNPEPEPEPVARYDANGAGAGPDDEERERGIPRRDLSPIDPHAALPPRP